MYICKSLGSSKCLGGREGEVCMYGLRMVAGAAELSRVRVTMGARTTIKMDESGSVHPPSESVYIRTKEHESTTTPAQRQQGARARVDGRRG